MGSSNGTGSNISTGRIKFPNSVFFLELSIRFSVVCTPRVTTVINPMSASRMNSPPSGTAAECFRRRLSDFLRFAFCGAFSCFGFGSGFACGFSAFGSGFGSVTCSGFGSVTCSGFGSGFGWVTCSGFGSVGAAFPGCSTFCQPCCWFRLGFFLDILQPHFIRCLPAVAVAAARFSLW